MLHDFGQHHREALLRDVTKIITEQNDEAVTLAMQDEVQKIPRAKIEKVSSQTLSLMPEHLLNRVNEHDLRDLLAFLE